MVASHLWSCDLISPFRTIELYRLATLEACLVTLFPYAAYMMADGLELSGIVAILFAGIVRQQKHAQHLHEYPKKLL
jgi:sodium/hydrogen exchanger 8